MSYVRPLYPGTPQKGENESVDSGAISRPRNVLRKVRVESTYTGHYSTSFFCEIATAQQFCTMFYPVPPLTTQIGAREQRRESKETVIWYKILPNIHALAIKLYTSAYDCFFQNTLICIISFITTSL